MSDFLYRCRCGKPMMHHGVECEGCMRVPPIDVHYWDDLLEVSPRLVRLLARKSRSGTQFIAGPFPDEASARKAMPTIPLNALRYGWAR